MFSMVLAACTSTQEASPSPSSKPSTDTASPSAATASKPVQISVFAQQANDIDLNTNLFTKHLESKFNAKFKFDVIPYDGAKEKRQISLASGDYPEAYMLTAYIDQFSQADL